MEPTAPSAGSYAGTRALVLGATGFIGRWVSGMLTAAGAQVLLGVRDPAAAGLEGEAVAADLAVPGRATELVERVRPAIVFNLAGYGVDPAERDADLARRINVELPGELCRALAGNITSPGAGGGLAGARLVHVGSGLEYGSAGGDFDEETSARPTTMYARSKLAGTRQVAALCPGLGVRGLTARPFTVYGHGERPGRLLPSLLRATRSGEAVELTAGDQRRDFTYVEDVAAGLLRLGLADVPPGATVNLATGRLTRVREFCEVAAGILGIPDDRLRYGALPVRAEEMVHVEVSVARLRRLTGWAPSTGIAAGIARTRDIENHL